MLIRAVEDALEEGILEPEDLVNVDDGELMTLLRIQDGKVGERVNAILNRNLPKKAFKEPLKNFKNWRELIDLPRKRKRELEESIALSAKIDPEEVILYSPNSWFTELKPRIYRGKKLIKLEEASILSRVLKEAQWDYSYINVLCPKKYVRRVKRTAYRILESV